MGAKNLIPSTARHPSPTTFEMIRRPRVKIKPVHNVSIQLSMFDTRLELANVSLGGIGVLHSGARISNRDVEANMYFENYPIQVKLLMRHCGTDIVGFSFVDPSLELINKIDQHFSVDFTALGLQLIDTNKIEDQCSILLCAPTKHCHLVLREQHGQLQTFGLRYLNFFFDGNSNFILFIGEEVSDTYANPKASLFRPITSIEPKILRNVIRLIEGIDHLTDAQRESLAQPFKKRGELQWP